MGNQVDCKVRGDEAGTLENIKSSFNAEQVAWAMKQPAVQAHFGKFNLDVPTSKMEMDDTIQTICDDEESYEGFSAKLLEIIQGLNMVSALPISLFVDFRPN